MRIIKQAIKAIKLRLPIELPRTDAGFEKLTRDVCDAAGVPVNNSTQFTIATMISTVEPKDGSTVRPIRLVRALKRAMTNQAAYSVLVEIKAKDKAEKEAQDADKKTTQG